MDRKRSVLAAGGVSAVLVVGSSAFAVASGIFVSTTPHPTGTLQAANAPLRPSTSPVRTPPPRQSVAPTAPSTQYPVAAPERFRRPTSVPAIQPARATTITHSGPSAVAAAHDDDRESAEGGERDD